MIQEQTFKNLDSDLEALSVWKKRFKEPCGCPNYPSSLRVSLTLTIERLSKFNPDMILILPLKTGIPIDTALKNLENLDLPMKTGLIIALDALHTINKEWLKTLEARLKQIHTRFVYSKLFFTTNIPPERWLSPATLYLIRSWRASHQAKFIECGFKDLEPVCYPYYVVREETRILVKHLNCLYVFWLDADVKPRRDVLSRLLDLIQGPTSADMAAGWYFDRRFPFKEPCFAPDPPLIPETAEDQEHVNRGSRLAEQLCVADPGYWISPNQLNRMTEPISIKWCGFGCVLLSKELNDQISFFSSRNMAEDVDFGREAGLKGFKLFVDPQCFCEHDEE